MTRVNKYDTYKDSGIEWVGEIPTTWQKVRLRFLCNIQTGDKDTVNKVDDGMYPFYVRSPIVERINTYTFDGEAILTAGDGVGAGKVFHYVTGKFDYHQRVYNLHNFKRIFGKFLYLYLKENFYKEIEKSNAKSTVDSIRLPMLLDFPVVFPVDTVEQQVIADYLDKKCGEIDKVIETEKAVIERLKEYKQSVITEAVTKGLDKSVPLKDSGIEWIGKIPQHWEVCKLLKLYKERKCKNTGNIETNVLSLSYGNIKKRNIENNMGLLPASFETYNVILPDNIVLRLTDLQNDHKSLRCGLAKEKGIITSAYVTLENKTNNVSSNYYYRLLHTFDIMKGFYGMGDGVRQNLKYEGELCNLFVVKPLFKEQQQIADYLDKKCSEIDKAITGKEQLIEKLTEYKKSLIYECVTGKRKVVTRHCEECQ